METGAADLLSIQLMTRFRQVQSEFHPTILSRPGDPLLLALTAEEVKHDGCSCSRGVVSFIHASMSIQAQGQVS